MRKLISAGLLMVLCTSVLAQQADSVRKDRLIPLAVGAGAAYAGTMIYLNQQWYSQYESQPFTFFNDAGEWKQMDKMGHMYGAYQLQNLGFHGLRWTGLGEKKAVLWSGITSFVFMSSIELFDAYSTGYGASVSDIAANTLGIGIFTAQQLGWHEIRIHPKFSFGRTDLADQRPEVLGDGWHEELVKDYNGQTLWLSFDIKALTQSRFPGWLNIAVGYGAQDMIYAEDMANIEAGLSPYRQWYIGPDIDLTHFHSRSKFVNTLLFALNMIRIPAPALEYSKNGVTWYWLK